MFRKQVDHISTYVEKFMAKLAKSGVGIDRSLNSLRIHTRESLGIAFAVVSNPSVAGC